MDLRHLDDSPSDAERRAVDAVLSPRPPGTTFFSFAEAKARRTLLLPALWALQERVGHVSKGGLAYVCRRLELPPAEGFAVASFYALLSLGERPAAVAHLCDDVACKLAGADRLADELTARLGAPLPSHAKSAEAKATASEGRWTRSPCLGLCDQAPGALVTVAGEAPLLQSVGHATAARVEAALGGERLPAATVTLGAEGPRRLLARAGRVNPQSLDDYRAHGGYQALRRAFDLGPEGVLRELHESRLCGRGGAAFPTGKKWEAVARSTKRPRYVVCNADESEPGTFKDRVLLEQDPFAVLEGMTLAAFATGAEKGYLYVRGEYPLAARRLSAAIDAARARGLLGPDVLGKGLFFDVELRRGAGAYICGEETALFSSIEGYRGEPRTKPPFPVEAGLFGKPTVINNVETLVAALDVVRDGAAAYAKVGTRDSPGTKLFCVSGSVRRPGVYEVPFGTRLSALLELAGGTPRPLRAVLLGGAAGTFVGPQGLSLELSFEAARAAKATLGSGVVLVIDEAAPLGELLGRIAAFFRDESCGQCVPCRVGTVRQEEALARLARGAPPQAEEALVAELGQVMRDASICGLGQSASSAIESALKALQPFEGKAR